MRVFCYCITILICFFEINAYSQANLEDYSGGWKGKVPGSKNLNIDIGINILDKNKYVLQMERSNFVFQDTLRSKKNKYIFLETTYDLSFIGYKSQDRSEISGFIRSGFMLYHVSLQKVKQNYYQGQWNIFITKELVPNSLFLSFIPTSKNQFMAFLIFADQRFTGSWCSNFLRYEDSIYFSDLKTGMRFKGALKKRKINLEFQIAGKSLSTIKLKPTKEKWNLRNSRKNSASRIRKPKQLEDGWTVSNLKGYGINKATLQRLVDSINANIITNTHSVLIAKEGKLIFEQYFSGYNHGIPHDQRSASKSIASAIIGIAINDHILSNVQQPFYELIPRKLQYTFDSVKKKITIKHLLTMSSGIDAIDFGVKRNSIACENNYQQSGNWVKSILEAPMISQPGVCANYGSANAYLLGIGLQNQLKTPLELYMDKKLLSPLGIKNYIIQTDLDGCPYFGGGMYLTPRDMLKFGQLYLDMGLWKSKQVIPKEWIKNSFKKHQVMENTTPKKEYGYLWWHNTYKINKKKIHSIEARGAGGQYIFIVPQMELVVAITSSNFRNGRFNQPELIMNDYILPSISNAE